MRPSNIIAVVLAIVVLVVVGYLLYEGIWFIAEAIAHAIDSFEYN